VVLAGLVGWSLQRFAGLDGALLWGVLAGLLAAPFVPARAACPHPSGSGGDGR
jgi:hypothetical protein